MGHVDLHVATGNVNKIKEMSEIFSLLLPGEFRVRALSERGELPDVIEDRDTFEGNAIKKAVELSAHAQRSVVSEDSGLVVDALYGAPGVHSARYAGVTKGRDAANNAKLVAALSELVPPHPARYVAVVCLALTPDDDLGRVLLGRLGLTTLEEVPAGEPEHEGRPGLVGNRVVVWWRGECEGEIVSMPRGTAGFGYDPHFLIPALNHTLAEVTLEQKSALSHRRHAIEHMCEALKAPL